MIGEKNHAVLLLNGALSAMTLHCDIWLRLAKAQAANLIKPIMISVPAKCAGIIYLCDFFLQRLSLKTLPVEEQYEAEMRITSVCSEMISFKDSAQKLNWNPPLLRRFPVVRKARDI